jgi:hypothetical protein
MTLASMLRQMARTVATLAPADQGKLAAAWDEPLHDLQWDITFANPRCQKISRRLAEQALTEEARGETEPGGFGLEPEDLGVKDKRGILQSMARRAGETTCSIGPANKATGAQSDTHHCLVC